MELGKEGKTERTGTRGCVATETEVGAKYLLIKHTGGDWPTQETQGESRATCSVDTPCLLSPATAQGGYVQFFLQLQLTLVSQLQAEACPELQFVSVSVCKGPRRLGELESLLHTFLFCCSTTLALLPLEPHLAPKFQDPWIGSMSSAFHMHGLLAR